MIRATKWIDFSLIVKSDKQMESLALGPAPPTWFPGCCWHCEVGSWWSRRSWTQSSWQRMGRRKWRRRRRMTRWGTWHYRRRRRRDPLICWLEWCRYCRSGCLSLGGEVEVVLWSLPRLESIQQFQKDNFAWINVQKLTSNKVLWASRCQTKSVKHKQPDSFPLSVMGCIFITLRILQNPTIAIKKNSQWGYFPQALLERNITTFFKKKTLLSVSDLYHKLKKEQREKKF